MEKNAFLVAYQRSYRQLLLVLPTVALVQLTKDKDTLSRVVYKNDASKKERSRCLLEYVMEELKEGKAEGFEQLLEVLAVHVDANNDIAVGRVLQSIHMGVKGTNTK